MIFSDVEDNLAFIAVRQLGWATGSWFVERCVALFEVSKCTFGHVGDLSNFLKGMSAPMEQRQGSASSLRSPLMGLHDVFDYLPRD